MESLTREQLQDAIRDPLVLLPSDLKFPAWGFVAHWSETVKGAAGTVSRALRAMADGLTPAEVAAVLAGLCRYDERTSGMKFGNDLMAELDARLDTAIKRKRSHEAAEARRQDGRTVPVGGLPSLAERMRDFGRMPE